ncbi:hypothetical protein BC831DRAFT_52216 [Entophlyctis helioformis]|nr:hypothetical protein BC831DRAFT_52216 [Entophlyctis helioformis]
MPALQSNAPAETTHEWDFDDESSEQSVPAVTASLPVEGSDAAPVAAPAPVPRGKDLAVAARPSSVSFADAPVISLSTSEEGAQQPQARKSRFVIDGRSGSTHSQSDATPASTPPDHPATANTSQPGSGSLALPASSALSSVANAQSYASPTASIATIQAGEVKKGRFSILESGATSSTSSAPTPAAPQPPAQQPSDASSITQIPMTQSPSVTSNASSSPGEGQVPTCTFQSNQLLACSLALTHPALCLIQWNASRAGLPSKRPSPVHLQRRMQIPTSQESSSSSNHRSSLCFLSSSSSQRVSSTSHPPDRHRQATSLPS